MLLSKKYIKSQVSTALKEDLGILGDITSQATIPVNHNSSAEIKLKEDAVLCGVEFAIQAFKLLDKKIKIGKQKKDGLILKKGSSILKIYGNTQAILAAERTALNFLGLMSGIATKANRYSKIAKKYGSKIYSTRKTIVGIRELQKYALSIGGANINRMTLDDFFFIKDNHISKADNIVDSIDQVRMFYPKKKITVEVDKISQLKQILNKKIDVVLLDNMNVSQIKKCLKLVNNKFECEASGNVSLKNLDAIAKTGVNRISTGQLTHSINNVDFGLEL
jgi:nicotinate-nucleotide pyrophosphorylase (carboxylating)|tara:strand:- start:11548 stop:12381 length:834 start_codon:yes stop_codon:yes gene_type:complete